MKAAFNQLWNNEIVFRPDFWEKKDGSFKDGSPFKTNSESLHASEVYGICISPAGNCLLFSSAALKTMCRFAEQESSQLGTVLEENKNLSDIFFQMCLTNYNVGWW